MRLRIRFLSDLSQVHVKKGPWCVGTADFLCIKNAKDKNMPELCRIYIIEKICCFVMNITNESVFLISIWKNSTREAAG